MNSKLNIKKVEHIAIIVSDLEQSLSFYNKLFGFEVRVKGATEKRKLAFLYLPQNPETEIELIQDIIPTQSYSEVGIVNHIAFQVENLNEVIVTFMEQGVKLLAHEPNTTIDNGRAIFLHGPDNELLQLIEK